MIILVNSAPQDAFNAFNADGQVEILGLIKPELLLRDMTDGVMRGGIELMTERIVLSGMT